MSVYELVGGAAVFALLVLGHALLSPYWDAARTARQRQREAENRRRFHQRWYDDHHDAMDP